MASHLAAADWSIKPWRFYVKKARLPSDTTFHTLRHMFSTLHIEHGTDQSELMAVGGWLNTRSVQRYLHIRNKHKGNVAQRLEGFSPTNKVTQP